MKLGQRMIRLDDGMKGVVALNGPDLRVVYVDRGEERIASKGERWKPDELVMGPLRSEEIAMIALHADRALRAFERHEPLKSWEHLDTQAIPYDAGLVLAITDYLSQRTTRSATNE